MPQLKMSRRSFLKTALIGGAVLATGAGVATVLNPPKPDDGTAATYYGARREQYFVDFDDLMTDIHTSTAVRGGVDLADAVVKRAREELNGLFGQLPYIGGDKNELTGNLVQSAGALAFYRAMKERGRTVEEIGEVLYEGFSSYMARTPGWMVGIYTGLQSMGIRPGDLEAAAVTSQKQQYPEDWVFSYVKGDGTDFDWGVDYTECGVCKFFHAQGADELTPYLCVLDFPISKTFQMGLARTETLAMGGKRCDFRYKAGRETPAGWPPPLTVSEFIGR